MPMKNRKKKSEHFNPEKQLFLLIDYLMAIKRHSKIYAVFLYKNIVLIFYVKSFYHYYIVKIFLIQLNIIYIISKSDNLLSNQ